ncbi:MAG: response regulator [Leptolyngbyaceae cyanobacterium CRU_2_3]|nr:response regulator [Leptolyngbyaceae cyanobacterium CRU_2_3]
MIPAPIHSATSLDRILLVEDNHTSRQLMSDYLEHHGWDVMSLERGDFFAASMNQFKPQLILLDLKLPDVDGYTLLQQVQQNIDWRSTPVIVVSAFAFQADQQRALDLGARRYLVKPVNLAQLRQVICEELGTAIV